LKDLPKRFPKAAAEVRGLGLMIGIRCVAPAYDVVAKLREAGLLTVPAADNVVRLLPPLNIDQRHVDEAVAIIESVIAGVD
jgi:acetylornithine/N-succinyldiaminopimelate aminotransferase